MCNKVLGSVLVSAVILKRELLFSSQFFIKTLKTDDRFHDNFFNDNFFNDNFFNDNFFNDNFFNDNFAMGCYSIHGALPA